MRTPHRTGSPTDAAAPPSSPRLVLGWIAVVGTLPYLVLKVMWVLGSDVGLTTTGVRDDPTLEVANWATLGMEVVAVALAMALTYRWGMRLPAWLVVFPIWVATGLLAPRCLYAVVLAPVSLGSGEGHSSSAMDQLEGWVYPVVSLSFAVQGIALAAAFTLYCRTRWGRLLGDRVEAVPQGATGGLQTVLTGGAAAFAAVLCLLSGTAVVVAADGDRAKVLAEAALSLVWILTAIVGTFMITRRFGVRTRLWYPVTLVWFGSGAMVWWGIFSVLNALADTVLADAWMPVAHEVARFGGVCVGLVLALVAAVAVVERERLSTGAR